MAFPDPTTSRPDLDQLPPGVIPDPHRRKPNDPEESVTPMHGTDSDNKAIAPGEGSASDGAVPLDRAD